MKYKILREDIVKTLIKFLDEVQFDAAGSKEKDDLYKVNFCSWAIQELLNSFGVSDGKVKSNKKNPKKKTRSDYIDETFLDWNLPEMSDKEFEKLVDTFDNFLRAWEKEYLKDNPQKKPKKKRPFKPSIIDIAQHCSLEEISDMLLDDPELTPEERFDLYYEEHERIQKENEPKFSLDDMCKKLKINLPPKDKRN
tara:strand:+ start:2438 stop:3022 length:585 start_codon:yes stop_codon:yes gene_type:complete